MKWVSVDTMMDIRWWFLLFLLSYLRTNSLKSTRALGALSLAPSLAERKKLFSLISQLRRQRKKYFLLGSPTIIDGTSSSSHCCVSRIHCKLFLRFCFYHEKSTRGRKLGKLYDKAFWGVGYFGSSKNKTKHHTTDHKIIKCKDRVQVSMMWDNAECVWALINHPIIIFWVRVGNGHYCCCVVISISKPDTLRFFFSLFFSRRVFTLSPCLILILIGNTLPQTNGSLSEGRPFRLCLSLAELREHKNKDRLQRDRKPNTDADFI